MSKDFQWKARTPSSLIEVVSHLRRRWEDGEWKVSQVTEKLLFSALHPLAVVDALAEHRLALGHLKNIAGIQQVQIFNLLLNTGTEPALFHAYYDLRRSLLVRQAEGIFVEFCSVGRAQSTLLQEDFIAWARAHVNDLVEGEKFRTPFWIKCSCDVHDIGPLTISAERLHWLSWRAPRLIVMKPSRSLPYDPGLVWERSDEEESASLLQAFSDEVKLSIEVRLDQVSGAIRLDMAKRPVPNPTVTPAAHQSPVAPSREPVSFSPDYQSLLLFGEQIFLTPRQAKLISILHEAYKSDHPDVSKRRLLEAIEAETSDVRDFFRKTPLWQTVVYSVRKGTFRLNLHPAAPRASESAGTGAKTGKTPT